MVADVPEGQGGDAGNPRRSPVPPSGRWVARAPQATAAAASSAPLSDRRLPVMAYCYGAHTLGKPPVQNDHQSTQVRLGSAQVQDESHAGRQIDSKGLQPNPGAQSVSAKQS